MQLFGIGDEIAPSWLRACWQPRNFEKHAQFLGKTSCNHLPPKLAQQQVTVILPSPENISWFCRLDVTRRRESLTCLVELNYLALFLIVVIRLPFLSKNCQITWKGSLIVLKLRFSFSRWFSELCFETLSIARNLYPAKNQTLKSYRAYISPTK